MVELTVNGVEIPEDQIADLCREYRVRRLSLFGSILTPGFRPGSDVDVLVEFEPDARIGFIGFADLELALCEVIGRRVDLNTLGFLSRHFRDKVIAEAEDVYAA